MTVLYTMNYTLRFENRQMFIDRYLLMFWGKAHIIRISLYSMYIFEVYYNIAAGKA